MTKTKMPVSRHECTDECPQTRVEELPDTDDTLRALVAPGAGWRLVLVCHPVEAAYVAAAVEEELGAVDLVQCETRDAEGVTVHSDPGAATSVHATARVPAGKMFAWRVQTAVPKADRDRWANAPGEAPASRPSAPKSSTRRGEQGALEFA